MKYGVVSFVCWLMQFIDTVNEALSMVAVTLSILVSIIGLYRQLKDQKK
jgi:hypothetical protein